MSCAQCGNPLPNEMEQILLNADGDFACSKACQEAYEREKERFFNEIIHSDEKFDNWMMGKDV